MWVLQGTPFLLAVAGAVFGALLFLTLLHNTPNQAKRYVVTALTFLGGLFYVVEFFIPPDPSEATRIFKWNLTATAQTVGNATQVVAGFTFLLGVYNLARIHGNNIRRLREGWGYSVSFFAAFFVMVVGAFWRDWHTWFGKPGTPETAPSWIKDTVNTPPHDLYTVLFEGLYRALESTMFSILAFYIVSAAYRAFRIRSGEAAVLMVTALILMMGQVPLGMALTNWIPAHGAGAFGVEWSIFRIENFSQYILTAINAPVQRAIGFGLGLGALAMALRIWLSLERGTYFSGEE